MDIQINYLHRDKGREGEIAHKLGSHAILGELIKISSYLLSPAVVAVPALGQL